MPKVSIIVPLYNQEKYIKQCLDSIQNQTLKDFECIIVNDGSTDKSLEIANSYLKDSRFKIISQENSGYGKAMNVGMDAAIGEYVGIVEPDDWIDSKMYETLYNKAKEFDLEVIKSDFYKVYKNEQICYRKLASGYINLYNKIIKLKNIEGFTFNWCGIYLRIWLNRHNIKHNETPGAAYQDTGFWAQVAYYAEKAMIISEAFYYYRCEAEGNSMSSKGKVFSLPSEWAFIQQKLNLNLLDTSNPFIAYLWRKHYGDSWWGFWRARGLKAKLTCLFRFAHDFRSCPIDQLDFSEEDKQKLKLLINDPIAFYILYTKSGKAANEAVLKTED